MSADENPVIEDEPQVADSKPQTTEEIAVSNFGRITRQKCPVVIMLRIRPFFENEKLVYERSKPSYFATV